ncbi:hypothetical protein KY338_02630 [Candidatus Woesearchaeota archaeon]|nr:hypothetical protein [Candidatus Woesearchaeota archaeon]MBW3005890.1 hypothetical protein [Candidatus Woesearchaeota archaeon]
MNYFRKGLYICGLALALATGCVEKPKIITGTVEKEGGTLVQQKQIIEKSSGAIFGNESIKFGDQTYVLTVDTAEGRYVVSVKQVSSKPLAALEEAIEQGDTIEMTIEAHTQLYRSKDKIGYIWSDDITLKAKGEKKDK